MTVLAVSGTRGGVSPLHFGKAMAYALDAADASGSPISVLRVGDATCVDQQAAEWARALGIPVHRHRAHWSKYGRAAGSLRLGVH